MNVRGERGTAIVEMALALPVFLLLTVGVFDLGRAVYVRNALSNAARDAARFASVDPANEDCVKSVAGFHDSLVGLTLADVSYTPPASPTMNQPVTVTVQTTYQPITPLVRLLIGTDNLTLTANTTMYVRNVPSGALACPPPPTPVPTPTTAPPPATIAPTPGGETPTVAPTATDPTETPTSVPPTATTVPPTATTAPPTPTTAPPTPTTVPPTATSVPPTPTVPPTATIGLTATSVPPTVTPVVPTATPTPCTLPPGQCKKLQ
jgi:hypothetical protein